MIEDNNAVKFIWKGWRKPGIVFKAIKAGIDTIKFTNDIRPPDAC